MGERRQRAQTRLAVRGAAPDRLPPFGVNNQLRGQYFFNADAWFAQMPPAMDGDKIGRTLLAGPPVQAPKDVPHTLAGLRSVALDPMYQLK